MVVTCLSMLVVGTLVARSVIETRKRERQAVRVRRPVGMHRGR
jgi:hypothetical protein